MRDSNEEELRRKDAIAQHALRPSRALQTIAIRVILCIGFCLALLFLFPNRIHSERLGEIAAFVAIFLIILPVFVNWLWQERRWFLSMCCVVLAVMWMFMSLGVPSVPENRLRAFQAAAEQTFVLEAAGDETHNESILRHPGLGISVRAPGTDFTTMLLPRINAASFGWAFVNREHRQGVTVCAEYCRLGTPADLWKALHDTLRKCQESVVKERPHAKLTVEQEDVVWLPDSQYAEAEGLIESCSFCLRIVPIDGGHPGPHPIFGVFAVSTRHSIACEIARSLRIAGTEWAGSDRNSAAH